MPKRLAFVLIVATMLALAPGSAFAQGPDGDDGVLIRIDGNITVAEGERVGTVFVIDGDAIIAGSAREVIVISGTARISGTVGELVVISGDIDLASGSTVGDITSVSSDIRRAPDATVSGEINERDGMVDAGALGWLGAVFSFVFWISMTLGVLIAGLLFAAIGGRQLLDAARAMTGDAANTIIGFVVVWVALPIAAVLVMLTLIGIPVGLAIILFVLPVIWFLGYIVAGARLGTAILRSASQDGHPYAATALGLILLQLLVLVPILGALVASIAGFWGSGALAYRAYKGAAAKKAAAVTVEAPTP